MNELNKQKLTKGYSKGRIKDQEERDQTWPSDRNPATSMTGLNSLGSNSGLLTPTFASANPTPTRLKFGFFISVLIISSFDNPAKNGVAHE